MRSTTVYTLKPHQRDADAGGTDKKIMDCDKKITFVRDFVFVAGNHVV